MRIRALSVFEGVVYHCAVVDRTSPCRPRLEVDARTMPGDLDAGPLLLTVADYSLMVGDPAVAADCLRRLRGQGRIVRWMDVDHVAFPTWTSVPAPDPR